MEISMSSTFQILKDNKPISKEDVSCLSIGGFTFEIGDKLVPFDWDASCGDEEDTIFNFETGRGPFFNDYELPDYYDDDYEELGLTREDITAEFLASVNQIIEFYINFDDADGKEQGIGWHSHNAGNSQYKVKLLAVSFVDIETEMEYKVAPEVIDLYNKGV